MLQTLNVCSTVCSAGSISHNFAVSSHLPHAKRAAGSHCCPSLSEVTEIVKVPFHLLPDASDGLFEVDFVFCAV